MNANSSDRSSQRCDASSASPAAGEQAGAVAKLRHVYTNLVNGGVRDTTSAKRIAAGLLSPAIEVLERLAAPGAAIAAREQEDAARYRELRDNSHPLTGRFDITEGDPPRHLYGEQLDAALAAGEEAKKE